MSLTTIFKVNMIIFFYILLFLLFLSADLFIKHISVLLLQREISRCKQSVQQHKVDLVSCAEARHS